MMLRCGTGYTSTPMQTAIFRDTWAGTSMGRGVGGSQRMPWRAQWTPSPNTVDDVTDRLTGTLDASTSFVPFRGQYFLRGTAASTGRTEDDLPLVLVRR